MLSTECPSTSLCCFDAQLDYFNLCYHKVSWSVCLTHLIRMGCSAESSWSPLCEYYSRGVYFIYLFILRRYFLLKLAKACKRVTVIRCLSGRRKSVHVGKYRNSIHRWIFPIAVRAYHVNLMENIEEPCLRCTKWKCDSAAHKYKTWWCLLVMVKFVTTSIWDW